MTLDEAFCQLTLDHIETALAADEAHGFPQDVFGLARLMLRTLALLASDSGIASGSPFGGGPDIDASVARRVAEMMELEQHKHGQNDDEALIQWLSDTRH
ncbi:MAG: hypothetical protein EON56_02065 [Alphaproteobacteria bacterium]|nr:MAG: hypothetical protein EON56_02065 [Alphaproteobacteria bacterium]